MDKKKKREYNLRLKEMARDGRFDENSTEHIQKLVAPVGEEYKYLPKNIFFRVFSVIIRALFMFFAPLLNFFNHTSKIIGRKHLKGIKSAVTISNHVFYLDNVVIRQAVRGHKLYLTVAPFNCKKGFGGLVLRAGGILPFSDNYTAMKNLYRAIETLLKKGAYIHVYPEQSLWLEYEKNRPLKKTAFSIAVKNNVPVIPMFFLFRERKGIEKIIGRGKIAILKITKPIYPDNNLSHGENTEKMHAAAELAYKRAVIEHYGYDEENYSIYDAP